MTGWTAGYPPRAPSCPPTGWFGRQMTDAAGPAPRDRSPGLARPVVGAHPRPPPDQATGRASLRPSAPNRHAARTAMTVTATMMVEMALISGVTPNLTLP